MDSPPDYGIWIIGTEIALLLLLIIVGIVIYRKRKVWLKEKESTHSLLPDSDISIQELVDKARRDSPDTPLNIVLGSGSYTMEKELEIKNSVRLYGASVEKTKLISAGDQPAIRIQDAKDCLISNMRVEGSIQCKNGDVQLKHCHIVAKEDGVCIEAHDGSNVTFSGLIRGEGGVAIRAAGGSQVKLKPPYALSGDDYIVMDPKSSVKIEEKKADTPNLDKTDSKP